MSTFVQKISAQCCIQTFTASLLKKRLPGLSIRTVCLNQNSPVSGFVDNENSTNEYMTVFFYSPKLLSDLFLSPSCPSQPPLRVLRPLTRSRSALSSNNEAMWTNPADSSCCLRCKRVNTLNGQNLRDRSSLALAKGITKVTYDDPSIIRVSLAALELI